MSVGPSFLKKIRLVNQEEQEERMANTRARAESHFSDNFVGELIDSLPLKGKKNTKHVGFREIRFKNGRVEFDYTVTTGKIINEGTMIVRHTQEDEIGQIATALAHAFGNLYSELERGH
jgi:hypothetical protein